MRGRAARARDAMEPSTATLEDLTPVRKRLQVEVPADAVQAELDRTFHEVGQRARLRGFRPGKAPRPVLERVFGEEVRRTVLSRLSRRPSIARSRRTASRWWERRTSRRSRSRRARRCTIRP